MPNNLDHKLTTYYITAIFSRIFAVTGFSYNAWRLEITEDNNNIRTASFEVLKELADLQQLIYSGHYDNNMIDGNPRKGWVKIGLIVDLSTLISSSAHLQSRKLESSRQENWSLYARNRDATDTIILNIELVRSEIKQTLLLLE